MNERERFIRAIEAEPEDDAVRLVFADWWEENGDSDRARFIRLQCEHHRLEAQLESEVETARQRELGQQIASLLKTHREEWTAGLPTWARENQFERGFLHIFQMTGKQFLDSAGAVRAIAPLDTLFLHLLEGREKAVFASEHLAGLSRLWVESARITDTGMAALTSSPHLRRLRRLGANRNRPLAEAKDANKLTDASAFALAETGNLPVLESLALGGYKKITLAGIQAIVESPRRAGLTALDLSEWPGGPEFATLFHGAGCRLDNLQELLLNNCRLGDEGVETLARADALRHLERLWLTQNKIGDRGVTALASSPHLSGLTDLDLWKNSLTDASVRAILASPHLRGLRTLELGQNSRITDAGARALLDDGRAWIQVGLDGTQVSSERKAQVAALGRHSPGRA
jgi:uncharacterized protein (TIGR02996 family)